MFAKLVDIDVILAKIMLIVFILVMLGKLVLDNFEINETFKTSELKKQPESDSMAVWYYVCSRHPQSQSFAGIIASTIRKQLNN